MTEREAHEKPEQDEAERNEAERSESRRAEPQPDSPDIDAGIADLRDMQASGEHLDKTIEEAREAVQAAREADSMRSPGTQGQDAQEQGPQASG